MCRAVHNNCAFVLPILNIHEEEEEKEIVEAMHRGGNQTNYLSQFPTLTALSDLMPDFNGI
ncbi:hypothetical protein T10_5466 [Trichinella papuae]|uniref:Uncharacterized protein n=1 Tax=Trichinella papuae TaxID=268474 RepID=A0A0V1MI51_9BILA|nr:hypothetical protein T10_5466 [Trichinella papuae]